MCDLTEISYSPGEIVWVKLGNCWWPGEVKDMDSLPAEIIPSLKKKPIAVVKFFGEDSYEYVKNLENIYHYNTRKKMEFIKKGMALYRSKSKQGLTLMEKFPTDVVTAESLTNGDVNILSSVACVEEDRPQYKDLFGSPKKKSPKKGKDGKATNDKSLSDSVFGKVKPLIQLKQRITHPRFIAESDHEVRIRQQPMVTTTVTPEIKVDSMDYKCRDCNFSTNRQNVFILHCKAHRENILQPSPKKGKAKKTPKTPATPRTPKAQKRPKATPASTPKTSTAVSTPKSAVKTTPTVAAATTSSTPKTVEKPVKSQSGSAISRKIFQKTKKNAKKSADNLKKAYSTPLKSAEEKERDLEKRNLILADWDIEDDEEEENEFKKLKLELENKDDSMDEEEEEDVVDKPSSIPTNKEDSIATAETPNANIPSSDPSSVYDLIEDGDDFIPPSRLTEIKKSTPETANVPTESADTREFNEQIASLLQETSVPDLPQVPSFKSADKKANDIPDKQMNVNKPVENKQQKTSTDNNVNTNGIPTTDKNVFGDLNTPSTSTNDVQKSNGTDINLLQSQDIYGDPNAETTTYVLVQLDESGSLSQFPSLEGMGNTTLLAYDGSQEEGGTRTLYIDPSQLGAGTNLENLILAINSADGSGTSMMQIQPQQVLQVNDTTTDELSKCKQDILAVALANTQVLQPPSHLESVTSGHDAVVKVTNTTQSPVMTPRVAESKLIPNTSTTTENR